MSGRAWCILRTSGRNTIPLFETLNEDGFTAWTPIEVQRIRKRYSHQHIERTLPMTPSFVFAHADRLPELLDLANRHRKRQPDFSVFHYLGDIPLVSDAALNGLRTTEIKVAPKDKRRLYAKGARVKVLERPAFAGMSGIVQKDDGKFALVGFDGKMEVRVASFLLRDEKEAA